MKRSILVSGDVVVDHHIYEGKRLTPSATERQGVKVVRQHGGAKTLADLIAALVAQIPEQERRPALGGEADEWTVACPITMPPADAVPCGHHALAIWKPLPLEPGSKRKVWRADLLMGYGHDAPVGGSGDVNCIGHTPAPTSMEIASSPSDILVLDDAGFVFRHRASSASWLLPAERGKGPQWIVLKMSGPVCQGDLWHHLANHHANRLLVAVSANDLRSECIRLGSGLSWERTVEEIREALQTNPVLQKLATVPRHVVISFSADGALWLDNTRPHPRATLVFDAGGAEGAWARPLAGASFGYMSCMVSALVSALLRGGDTPDLRPGIRAGLAGMRNLLEQGHGSVSDQPCPLEAEMPQGFPIARLAKTILTGGGEFADSPVPWSAAEWAPYAASPEEGGERRPWRIVEMSQAAFGSPRLPSLVGIATQTVLRGETAIRRLPQARFRKLLTADRFEIEALRALERLMIQYREERETKRPLSIGVFGPPGAGKSFGVHQLADSVFGEKAWREFNLSQFRDEVDLIGAFHQVRDLVLGGLTPVIFWDEFDAREYHWLQYLLAPMQDGRFQEGQVNHAIGKCVFVFAGATSHAFAEFGPRQPGNAGFDADIWRDFMLKKGPDFHSRLDAYFDVLGPNRRTTMGESAQADGRRSVDSRDVCAPLRRALLIRAMLGLAPTAPVDFDADLLAALLRVPEFKHGARSLEKLVQAIRPASPGLAIRRAALLPAAQLAMHVDLKAFTAILDRHESFQQDEVIDALAPAIHEDFLKLAHDRGWPVQPRFDKPFVELAAVDREDNRAAARRIPANLALAGLVLEKASDGEAPDDPAIRQHLEYHLERLAEAEHEGWMDHRLQNGWRVAKERRDDLKLHPALVPYARLSRIDQDKDRNAVRRFPDIVRLAGYRITWT